jgi:hypothetical protein
MITGNKAEAKDFPKPDEASLDKSAELSKGLYWFPAKPEPFLTVRIQDLSETPSLTGLCVGYERSEWRASQFVDHVMEWLPEFALNHTELSALHSGNTVKLVREAARKVYESKKFKNRGEFGELFLHAAIRQVFDSLPAISKIYYKSALNNTVKGFDAVHVVGPADDMELWLGEAKFYSDFNRAVRDVVTELQTHTTTNYLRGEFLLIRGKIDPDWPHAQALDALLNENRSLDEVFSRVCLPVLLTYDSKCLGSFSKCDQLYQKAFAQEIRANHLIFKNQKLPQEIRIHLILLPLRTKAKLIDLLDKKLKVWQSL